jgi:putative FmdB family regulatory protein
MPLYEYECEHCGVRFEVIQKFSDPAVETCKTCGGKVRRLLSAPAIQFKGSGWYITDYAHKGMTGSDTEKTSSDRAADKPAAASGGDSSAKAATPASTPATKD